MTKTLVIGKLGEIPEELLDEAKEQGYEVIFHPYDLTLRNSSRDVIIIWKSVIAMIRLDSISSGVSPAPEYTSTWMQGEPTDWEKNYWSRVKEYFIPKTIWTESTDTN